MQFPIELKEHIRRLAEELQINPEDIEEHFTAGHGHGGQKRNRSRNVVELRHVKTGVMVRVEDHRHQHQNRMEAYERLIQKIAEEKDREKKEHQHEEFLEHKQCAVRPPHVTEKMFEEKIKRKGKKQRRGPINIEPEQENP